MNWELIAKLLVMYGLPLAEKLWQKWAAGEKPTQADFDELNALASETARSRMLAALKRAGIDPASDQGKALLALTPE